MKLEGAQQEIAAYMKQNKDLDQALLEKKIHDRILELSHKVDGRPDAAGHFARQQIRKALKAFIEKGR